MSPRIVGLLVLGAALAGPVAARPAPPAEDLASAWRGKTVALTQRPPTDFFSMTAARGEVMTRGMGALIEAGRTIIQENGIEDPAPRLARDLLAAAESRYGVTAAAIPPVKLDANTIDPKKLARAANGADLLFDIFGAGVDIRALPMQKDQYVVASGYKFLIIDVDRAKFAAKGVCFQKGDRKHPFAKDELLADHAVRLKQILDSQRNACLEEFKEKVLGIHAESAGSPH
jgi:hypothetical protein